MKEVKKRLYTIIFEADTRAGKIFDEVLLTIIVISVFTVLLESIAEIRNRYQTLLRTLEWIITAIFTIEYILRIWVSKRPWRYVFSFYGLIDFLSIVPTYSSIFFTGGQSLLVIRALRLLRVFRILKLTRFTRAGRIITSSVWVNKEKIGIFVIFVFTIAVIMGTLMYLIEGEENGFKDIPTSIYWAIVTLTTVGYGDLAPSTGLGQFLASIVMILGYAIIAVPTGIVTSTLLTKKIRNTQVCSSCMFDQHDDDARYCKKCGESLNRTT